MRSCPRQLAARLPPPRLPTSALAGPALAVLKVMKDEGQSNTPKTARWGRLSGLVDVRFGSKADIAACLINVRFTPKSGHRNSVVECPLSAKSGHSDVTRSPHRRWLAESVAS